MMKKNATAIQIDTFVNYFVKYEKQNLDSHIRYTRMDITDFNQFKKDLYYLYGYRSWWNSDSYVSFRDNGNKYQLAFKLATLNWELCYCTFNKFSSVLWQRLNVDSEDTSSQYYQLTLF